MREPRGWLIAAAAIAAALLVAWLAWHRSRHAATSTASSGSNAGGARVTGPIATAPTAHWLAAKGGAAARIAGVVVGEDGAPVAGATVSLASRLTAAGVVAPVVKTTDATGQFDFGAQALLEYVVSAESPHTTAAIEQVDLTDVNAGGDQLKLVLHTCDAAIHGAIFDAIEGPIRGATVTRLLDGAITHVAAEADDKGTYELCVPAGGADVMVSADGYGPRTETVSVYGRTRHDFRLAAGAPLVGRVIRADDKSPVAGALVEVRAGGRHADEMPQTTASDAQGKFRFDAVAPGRHEVTAAADRLVTRDPVSAIVEVGSAGDEIVCELVAAPSISGRVVAKGSTEPLVGFTASISTDGISIGTSHMRSAVVQPDGSFSIERVSPGAYLVSAGSDAESAAAQRVRVETRDITGLVFEVEDAGAFIEGRVVAAGKAVDGAIVTVGEWTAETDADGTFAIGPIPEGTYDMSAASDRAGAFARERKITVAANEHKTGVEIALDLSASISGTVVDQNGAPVGGAFLAFSLLHGTDVGAATTADDGTFMAREIAGGGNYVYEVRQSESSALVYPPLGGKRHPPIAVADGTTHVTGIRVTVRVDKLAIRGRVVSGKGQGVADVVVTAEPASSDWDSRVSATTDETGAFALADLLAGPYVLRAVAPRGTARVDNVPAGKTGLILRLLELGRITGTWKGFSDPPEIIALRIDDDVSTYNASVSGNTFDIRSVPAGSYEVVAHTGREHSAQTVELGSGETKTLAIVTGETGTLTGIVVDAKTKAPVAGLQCAAGTTGEDFDPANGTAAPTTDARGAFRIDRVHTGFVMVRCTGHDITAWDTFSVTAGKTTDVQLVAKPDTDEDKPGRAGMTLENQLDEVLVESVAAGGAAARAGVVVGDVVKSVNGEAIRRDMAYGAMVLIDESENEAKLVLERADKPLEITLKLAR